MARAVGKVIEILRPNVAYEEASTDLVAIDATDGIEFSITERDNKYLFKAVNSDSQNAETLTIKKAGNGPLNVADLTISVAKSATVWFTLDTARFKNLTGANKGKIIMAGSADLAVAAYRLP